MLIVEGGDLVGKTTFCHKLQKELASMGYWYHHLTRVPERGFDACQDYMDMTAPKYVQDRFHMSEIVYCQFRNNETMLTPERYRLVDAHLRMMGAFTVVIVCVEDELLKERHAARCEEEMYGVEEVLKANTSFYQIIASGGNYSLGLDDYKMDVDMRISIHPDKPFPNEEDLKETLERYLSRQSQVGHALGEF